MMMTLNPDFNGKHSHTLFDVWYLYYRCYCSL